MMYRSSEVPAETVPKIISGNTLSKRIATLFRSGKVSADHDQPTTAPKFEVIRKGQHHYTPAVPTYEGLPKNQAGKHTAEREVSKEVAKSSARQPPKKGILKNKTRDVGFTIPLNLYLKLSSGPTAQHPDSSAYSEAPPGTNVEERSVGHRTEHEFTLPLNINLKIPGLPYSQYLKAKMYGEVPPDTKAEGKIVVHGTEHPQCFRRGEENESQTGLRPQAAEQAHQKPIITATATKDHYTGVTDGMYQVEMSGALGKSICHCPISPEVS